MTDIEMLRNELDMNIDDYEKTNKEINYEFYMVRN